LEGITHKIEFWDSKLSGKKKLAFDSKVLSETKDGDNYSYSFKISGYIIRITQKTEDKFELKINDKNFMDLLKDERSGKLQKEREDYLKKKEKEKKKNRNEDDYYKRAMKYNGENYVEGEEDMYNIEEQRRRLEEFERKKNKQRQNDDNDFYSNEKTNDSKKKFVLDNKTVNMNRMIISNMRDVFDDENYNNGNINNNDGGNIFNINWSEDNDNNNFNSGRNNNQSNFFQDNNNNGNYNKKILDSNPDFYLNQMSNNLNNANNPHNQAILNQFLNFDGPNNNNNNNTNYNFNSQYQNNNMNNNFNNGNGFNNNNQNGNNNNYDDDFNPFED
jgi:hypothetical protein